MNRGSDLGSRSQKMGVGGIGSDLDLAGLGESPWVVPVRIRCSCFVGEGCRLGCSAAVEDSCFGRGCRKCLIVLVAACIDRMVGVGLAIGMVDSAGHMRSGVKEGRLGSAGGSAGCSPG